MIEFKNVSKFYGENAVYKNFNFSIEEGAVTCILGESGSGKTTLLNMLAGLTPYLGEITPRVKCSYVFQEPRLVPSLTVLGNLCLVCRDADRIRTMLAAVGLEGREGAYPRELSGGQAQRGSLARAYLYPSKAILMDEPFSSLDIALKVKMAALFLDLWRSEKRTAVFVTHDVDEAAMLANRVVVLKDGAVVADFSAEGEPSADLFAREGLRQKLLKSLLN